MLQVGDSAEVTDLPADVWEGQKPLDFEAYAEVSGALSDLVSIERGRGAAEARPQAALGRGSAQ